MRSRIGTEQIRSRIRCLTGVNAYAYYARMQPIAHIRQKVIGLSQAAFAEVAGTSQATVSRWEKGELEPSREQLQRIREEAGRRGIQWDDRWFFETPPLAPEPDPESEKAAS